MSEEEHHQQQLEQQEQKSKELWDKAPAILTECRKILAEMKNERLNK